MSGAREPSPVTARRAELLEAFNAADADTLLRLRPTAEEKRALAIVVSARRQLAAATRRRARK